MKMTLILAAILLSGVPAEALADGHRCGYDRDHWIGVYPYGPRGSGAEIRQGIRSGALSHDEARRLENERRDLNREYRRDAADGYISPSERRDLRHNERDYQRDLHHQLNDDERRW